MAPPSTIRSLRHGHANGGCSLRLAKLHVPDRKSCNNLTFLIPRKMSRSSIIAIGTTFFDRNCPIRQVYYEFHSNETTGLRQVGSGKTPPLSCLMSTPAAQRADVCVCVCVCVRAC